MSDEIKGASIRRYLVLRMEGHRHTEALCKMRWEATDLMLASAFPNDWKLIAKEWLRQHAIFQRLSRRRKAA